MDKVRLKDIALKAGVDISTVSRALNGDPEINEATQEAIRKLAKEMGYVRKVRQVRSGKIPGLVGIIIPEVLSGYYSAMLGQINTELQAAGKTSVLGVASFDEDLAQLYINGFTKAGAEGLIYIMDACEPPLKAKTERALRSCGLPIIFITGSYQPKLEFSSVYIDEMSGTRKAVTHLIEMGHKNIGFIGEIHTPGRGEACKAILEENGLLYHPEHFCAGTERLEKGGYLRMKELLSKKDRPSSVFIAYDQMAIGAIKALDEANLKVPQDLSVVSFDNIDASAYVLSGLTTVATPLRETANITVKLLLEQMAAEQNVAIQHITIQPTLIVRSSTSAAQ